MKKIIPFLILLFSCSSKKTNFDPKEEIRVKYVAVFTLPDSSRSIEYGARSIVVVPKRDSITKKYSVQIDTIWELMREIPVKDSLNKEKKDSLGRPVTQLYYFRRSNDSVRTNCFNLPVDSLLSKHSPTH